MLTESRLQEITLEAEKKYPDVYGDGYVKNRFREREGYIERAKEDEGRVKELVRENTIAMLDKLLDFNANGFVGFSPDRILMVDGEYYWESDTDGDQPISPEKLYDILSNYYSTKP